MARVYPIFDFVRENSEDIFVYDFSFSSVDCFVDLPKNLISWGGSTWKSDLFKKHLEEMGLEKLDMTTFQKKNVYFLSVSERSVRNFYSLLYESYGASGAVCTVYSTEESLSKFYVVKFQFEK